MAAFGKGVDALSIASPVLKSGPSAYETVTARMGIEGDQAKLAAAKEVEKDKAKAERGKAFEIDLGTVELPDTIAWNKKMAQEQDLYAAELQAFEEGKGDDPDDPRSKAGQARMARLQGYKQYVSNSKQKMAYGNTLLGLVRSKPHAYQAGAEEATLAWMSDPTVNETGEIIDPLEQYYNLDADLKATLGDLAASGGGTAGRDANGDVITTETEYVLPADVLGGVQMVLQNPAAGKEALRRFAELQGRDPVAAENVLKVAEKNKIPAEAAMIWNEAAKVYGYSKFKKSLSQESEGNAGRRIDEKGAQWFAEWLKGNMEGTYETVPEYKNDRPGFLFTDEQPANAPGWWNAKKVPTGLKQDDTMKGKVWDQKEVYDEAAKKNIKIQRDIKTILIDPTSKTFIVKVAPANTTFEKAKNEERQTIMVPFDQAESKIGQRILGLNKEQIKGQAIYDMSVEDLGYGERKGTGGGNIVKPEKQVNTETPAEAWARKQREAAARKAGK